MWTDTHGGRANREPWVFVPHLHTCADAVKLSPSAARLLRRVARAAAQRRKAAQCAEQMSAAIIQLVTEHVPAPLLWAAASAASCCGGLCVGLRLANPMAFEILMADEDDEDAQNNAIGQPTLNMFAQSVFISAPVNGCMSFYGLDSNISSGCCVLTFVIVVALVI